MKKRIEDNSTDLKKEYYFDDDGNMTVNYSQDVEGILAQNKAIGEINNGYVDKGRELKHVASIPMSVVLMWQKMGIDVYKKADWPKVKKLLNDPEWAYIRTGRGTI